MKRTEEIFAQFMENYDVEDSTAVKKSNESVLNYLCALTGKDKADIEDIVSYIGYAHEKQGFINGFEYAMRFKQNMCIVNQ